MSKKAKKIGMVVPLRVPPDMGGRIKELARENHLSEADIMRLAIERGFAAVERMFEHPDKQAA